MDLLVSPSVCQEPASVPHHEQGAQYMAISLPYIPCYAEHDVDNYTYPNIFRIQPFFQNMMDVGDALSVDFGEVVVGAH
jgi:hypothetical protein